MGDKFVLTESFIEDFIREDFASGKVTGHVKTRMPPEPNGYLHLGHIKAACINFGMAEKLGGECFMYYDDTNPKKESDEFVRAIQEDIKWLGFNWTKTYFASDHYQDLFDIAVNLIKEGNAYVCDLTFEEMSEYRGDFYKPGKESPYRNRTVEDNLALFEDMRQGKFPEGKCTLRAKIDMSAGALCMRDPVIYRIMHIGHFRAGDKWCIYPMYDYASPILDSLGGVTHSLCGPEFEERRPLYEWAVRAANRYAAKVKKAISSPRQIEFAKLYVKDVVLGKRHLLKLVNERIVSGWDDPRMPTLRGCRRRGYPAEALKSFINALGISKQLSETSYDYLEHFVRDNLKNNTKVRMAVIDPVKLIIDNYEGSETLDIGDDLLDPESSRKAAFSKELYIESSDYMEEPIPKYFRLYPGNEVRLKGAYIIKCKGSVINKKGEREIHCDYYPDSKSGMEGASRKVKGTIHWVSAKDNITAEFRHYDMLFKRMEENEQAESGVYVAEVGPVRYKYNPDSFFVKYGYAERALEKAETESKYQFLRMGYFVKDKDSGAEGHIFNRIIGLVDTFNK